MADLYKYFRIEANELHESMQKAALALDQSDDVKGLVAKVLRCAHTLKGAARIVKQTAIADASHAIEDVMEAHREGLPPTRERVDKLLVLLDGIAAALRNLDAPAAVVTPQPSARAAEPAAQTLRVEIAELDRLARSVSEASVHMRNLRRSLGERDRATLAAVDQADAALAEAHETSHRLRLVPVSTIYNSLERVVRDAAQAKVGITFTGEALRIDAQMLGSLRDAMLHIVRNAVVHGIEPAKERSGAGKPEDGSIVIHIERSGDHIRLSCRDDGRGIDPEAVRRAAVASGAQTAANAAKLSDEAALRLVLVSGVSTKSAVDQLSGRGVGLDVAHDITRQLGGDIHLASTRGRGTTITIEAPISLSALPALEVDIGASIVSLPLRAVRKTLRLDASAITRTTDQNAILHEGQVIPFLPLAAALGRDQLAAHKFWSVVLLEGTAGQAALGVERCLGTTTAVVRSLPALCPADPIVAGAALDAEGEPRLVLDSDVVIARAHAARARTKSEETEDARALPVLVVDDSLTTRMLQQSILESAGYTVELATSAEEGLSMARKKRHAIFLVDVEMPGMDGFSFVAETQADAGLRHTPAILVTSRNAPSDRQRAAHVGARGYVVKGQFDQVRMLQMIDDLIGHKA